MSSLEYIAAAEAVGPNSVEFERVLGKFQERAINDAVLKLKEQLFKQLNDGVISDDTYTVIWDHLNQL